MATGGDRAGSLVTGARKALTGGACLPERDRERARGVRADGWGRAGSGRGEGSAGERAGGSWAGNGPTQGGRFFLFLFYFLFLFSISISFIPFSFEQIIS